MILSFVYLIIDGDTETVANKWLVSLVITNVASATDRLNISNVASPTDQLSISKNVLKAFYTHTSQDHARLCMFLNIKMIELINKTRSYSQLSEQEEDSMTLHQMTSLPRGIEK